MQLLILFLLSISGVVAQPEVGRAQGAITDPSACYAVADNGGDPDPDVLVRINRLTGTGVAVVGSTGTFKIEAMAIKPGGTIIYAMDGDQLGALDINSGLFTPIGTPLGIVQGSLGPISIQDVDGLTYDPFLNVLYAAVARRTGFDLLIKLDPATGAIIPFSAGVEYRVLTVTGSPNNYQDFDDLAVDPITGLMYGISNNGGPGELVQVDVATGVSAHIGDFADNDVEGLSFFNDGQLYASNGVPNDPNNNNLYLVDKNTGAISVVGSLIINDNDDFEALGCLTAATYLAVEKTTNGVDADLPTGPAIIVNAKVNWGYTIRNTGVITINNITLVDDKLPNNAISCPAFPQPNNGLAPGEQVICTASGAATPGQYVNTATVTGNAIPAVGVSIPVSDTDTSHYLGVQPDLVITKNDGGITATPGSAVIYTLVYSNVGGIEATGVELTEVVPANTVFHPDSSSLGWSCTPNNQAGSVCSFPLGQLNANQRGSVDFAVTLAASWPLGVTQVENEVAIGDDESHGAEANPNDNLAREVTPVLASALLEADKVAQWADSGSNGQIDAGEIITYTIVVRNIGNQQANNVPVVDNPDPNSTLVVGSVTIQGGTGTISVGNNPNDTTISALIDTIPGNGGQVSIRYRVTINNPLPQGVNRIINQALVTNTIPLSTTVPAVAVYDLSVSKSDSGATSQPGGTLIYTLAYTNTGQRTATGVFLREVVPANSIFNANASQPTNWSCANGSPAGTVCTTTIGTLNVNAKGGARFAVTINNPVPAGVNQIDNLVRIADDGLNGDDPTPGNNQATEVTPLNAVPELAITKDDGSVTTQPGQVVVYNLGYSNSGSQNATGVVITDVVPANTTFAPASSTSGWLCTPDNIAGSSCKLSIGSVAGGTSGSVKFAVTVANVLPANVLRIDNTAQIGDDGRNGPEVNTANNRAADNTPVNASPDLLLEKDDGGSGTAPGGTVVYTLSYQNVGNRGTTGVVITDVVPLHSTFNATASQPTSWSCAANSPAGTLCTTTIGTLAVGSSGSVKFAITVNNPVPAGVTAISNRAGIRDDGRNGLDGHPEDNFAADDTPLNAKPDLTLTKSDGGLTTRPGQVVTYTLAYSNVGDVGATGLVINEVVPANTTFNAAASAPALWSCANGSPAGTSCTFSFSGLVAGGSGAVRFAVTVNRPLAAGVTQISNQAQISDDGSNGADPTPANNQATDTTPLFPAPLLTITKVAQATQVRPGDPLTYTLSYANSGDQDATGVVVREILPDWTDFNAGASTPGWTCTLDNQLGKTVCNFAVGTLKAGQAGALKLVFVVFLREQLPAEVTEIANQAQILDDGANGQPPGGPPTASVQTPVQRPTDLNEGAEPTAQRLFFPYLKR